MSQMTFDISQLQGLTDGQGQPLPKGRFNVPVGPGNDPEFVERELDVNYHHQRDVVRWMAIALTRRFPMQFIGPYGSGKTSGIEQFLLETDWPFVKVSCHDGLEVSDLIGMYVPTASGAFKWVEGPVIVAMKRGIPIIFDERPKLRPEVAAVLNAVLDGQPIDISEMGYEGGESPRIFPNDGFVMLATGNSTGAGDESGVYVSDRVQGAEANSRWLTVPVGYMPRETEERIVSAKAPSLAQEHLQLLLGFADSTREAHQKLDATGEPELAVPFSTRQVVKAAQATEMVKDMRLAIEVSYLNGLPGAERAKAEELFGLTFGGQKKKAA